MARQNSPYRCTECGWSTPKWLGRCGECQAWGTVQEHGSTEGIRKRVTASAPAAGHSAQAITAITPDTTSHIRTGVGEFDRVLGGGIVSGAVVLLSGEPGVGKSTLLLDVAAKTASRGMRVLYISAEESVHQVRFRAERTGALHDTLFLAAETDLSTTIGHIDEVSPDLLIVDSVQTLSSSTLDGLAGQPGQVREVASTLIRVAKDRSIATLLVGHVTKDGSIAGPRMLEHLVDVVCHFEGDPHTGLRFVRALKNRYGTTNEVGCFEMTGEGIRELPDPSGLFLSGNAQSVSGTCVTVAMEGLRPLTVEIQALVVSSNSPQSRRVTNGIDQSRLAMILAVLEKRLNVRLSENDVYVSTLGGVRLTEPAADLAIAIAIVSSVKNVPVTKETAAFGEISLSGDIRAVSFRQNRRNEAKRLGFTRAIDSEHETLVSALGHAFQTG